MNQQLFSNESDGIINTAEAVEERRRRPRVQQPEREQMVMRYNSLDELLPEDHQARVVWTWVESIDLEPLYQGIKAVEGHVGRPPIAPEVLLALWLYATLDGVGSARRLARLCEEQVAYQWLCGGVSVNYHTLSDFRCEQGAFLDQLLTESVAAMQFSGLVAMKRVAQDGVRVRANAGAGSFRREGRLEQLLQEAKQQVELLRKELDADPGAGSRREQGARKRAAQERTTRLAQAKEELEKAKQTRAHLSKEDKQKRQVRASTTDPEARVMKMGDGGFRPAYNPQLATDTKSGIIVGVEVSNNSSDGGLLTPMLEQVKTRYGCTPEEVLVDGGYATWEQITKASKAPYACIVYAPVQKGKQKDAPAEIYLPKPKDSQEVAEWRTRMGTAEAQEIYKERAATAEWVNAQARNRGLQRFLVRGLRKVRAVLLLFALAHNLVREAALRAKTVALAA